MARFRGLVWFCQSGFRVNGHRIGEWLDQRGDQVDNRLDLRADRASRRRG